ncbi:hypothetical protein K488DRAFT_73730 [Vararia minispora EC-137]|uniref:Uncharacterized protein n=1 Tax=Vararia minispora EC-137 TaxID=1314806 RepID=A0ACB8Q9L6_9AGAM|nr:hypothetical protein K488DRAFT_73730 [Vararia minispora EC-137]
MASHSRRGSFSSTSSASFATTSSPSPLKFDPSFFSANNSCDSFVLPIDSADIHLTFGSLTEDAPTTAQSFPSSVHSDSALPCQSPYAYSWDLPSPSIKTVTGAMSKTAVVTVVPHSARPHSLTPDHTLSSQGSSRSTHVLRTRSSVSLVSSRSSTVSGPELKRISSSLLRGPRPLPATPGPHTVLLPPIQVSVQAPPPNQTRKTGFRTLPRDQSPSRSSSEEDSEADDIKKGPMPGLWSPVAVCPPRDLSNHTQGTQEDGSKSLLMSKPLDEVLIPAEVIDLGPILEEALRVDVKSRGEVCAVKVSAGNTAEDRAPVLPIREKQEMVEESAITAAVHQMLRCRTHCTHTLIFRLSHAFRLKSNVVACWLRRGHSGIHNCASAPHSTSARRIFLATSCHSGAELASRPLRTRHTLSSSFFSAAVTSTWVTPITDASTLNNQSAASQTYIQAVQRTFSRPVVTPIGGSVREIFPYSVTTASTDPHHSITSSTVHKSSPFSLSTSAVTITDSRLSSSMSGAMNEQESICFSKSSVEMVPEEIPRFPVMSTIPVCASSATIASFNLRSGVCSGLTVRDANAPLRASPPRIIFARDGPSTPTTPEHGIPTEDNHPMGEVSPSAPYTPIERHTPPPESQTSVSTPTAAALPTYLETFNTAPTPEAVSSRLSLQQRFRVQDFEIALGLLDAEGEMQPLPQYVPFPGSEETTLARGPRRPFPRTLPVQPIVFLDTTMLQPANNRSPRGLRWHRSTPWPDLPRTGENTNDGMDMKKSSSRLWSLFKLPRRTSSASSTSANDMRTLSSTRSISLVRSLTGSRFFWPPRRSSSTTRMSAVSTDLQGMENASASSLSSSTNPQDTSPGANANIDEDGFPTTEPVPGRPLLNHGHILVYPEGFVCEMCGNHGFLSEHDHERGGLLVPCKICWAHFARPFSKRLARFFHKDAQDASGEDGAHAVYILANPI